MPRPPERPRRISDPRDAAEAAFKKATARPADAPLRTALPTVKELVSLRLDSDVLEHFQSKGAGWQEDLNAALRKAAFGDLGGGGQ